MTRVILSVCLVLAACSDLPDMQRTISPEALNAPYPELLPLDELIAQAESGSTASTSQAAVAARVALLRRRAAALRGREIADGQELLRNIP